MYVGVYDIDNWISTRKMEEEFGNGPLRDVLISPSVSVSRCTPDMKVRVHTVEDADAEILLFHSDNLPIVEKALKDAEVEFKPFDVIMALLWLKDDLRGI